MIPRLVPCLLAFLLLTGAPAQVQERDPMQEILELIKQAQKELDAAERHLLEASGPASSGEQGPARELTSAAERQQAVIAAIQKILDSIPPDSRGGSSGPPPPRPDQQPPPEPSSREREQRPERVERTQPEQETGAGREQQAQERPDRAETRKGQPPPEDPTGRTPPAAGSEYWGNLPRFLQEIFRAGEEPRIPEKYRPFWRAFQERGQDREKR